MNAAPHIWQTWARALRHWGVQDLAAAFLESAGPLNLLGAQAVYLTQPVLGAFVSWDNLEMLANLLEDAGQRRAFTSLLQEETS
jgi:hypothetical protein